MNERTRAKSKHGWKYNSRLKNSLTHQYVGDLTWLQSEAGGQRDVPIVYTCSAGQPTAEARYRAAQPRCVAGQSMLVRLLRVHCSSRKIFAGKSETVCNVIIFTFLCYLYVHIFQRFPISGFILLETVRLYHEPRRGTKALRSSVLESNISCHN